MLLTVQQESTSNRSPWKSHQDHCPHLPQSDTSRSVFTITIKNRNSANIVRRSSTHAMCMPSPNQSSIKHLYPQILAAITPTHVQGAQPATFCNPNLTSHFPTHCSDSTLTWMSLSIHSRLSSSQLPRVVTDSHTMITQPRNSLSSPGIPICIANWSSATSLAPAVLLSAAHHYGNSSAPLIYSDD